MKQLNWLLIGWILSSQLWAFSCQKPMPIIQKPILFGQTRIELTRQYQLTHYGIDSKAITIEPRIVVLHWTEAPTLRSSFETMNSETKSRQSRKELYGDLNVSAHFLVDRDGTIYQLMPDNWMARHVIGLNHYAIGIENVGAVNEVEDLTEKQAEANAFLFCYLKKKYPTIKYLIGHKDYLDFKNSPLWQERDPNYHTIKPDPGHWFMQRVKQLLS